MRNFAIFCSLLATTGAAQAQPPALTPPVDAPTPAPQLFVAAGVLAGVEFSAIDGQIALEAGYHLSRAWALHGLIATGVANDDQGGGAIHQGRGGIEGQICTTHRLACAYTGLDLGYQAYTWRALETGRSPDEPHHDIIGVVRLGFDVGSRHVRVRPGIELYQAIAGDSGGALAGINLDLTVAYQW